MPVPVLVVVAVVAVMVVVVVVLAAAVGGKGGWWWRWWRLALPCMNVGISVGSRSVNLHELHCHSLQTLDSCFAMGGRSGDCATPQDVRKHRGASVRNVCCLNDVDQAALMICVSLSVSQCVFVCLCLSQCVPVCIRVFVCLLCVSVCFCVSLCLGASLCVSACLRVSCLRVSLYATHAVCTLCTVRCLEVARVIA